MLGLTIAILCVLVLCMFLLSACAQHLGKIASIMELALRKKL